MIIFPSQILKKNTLPTPLKLGKWHFYKMFPLWVKSKSKTVLKLHNWFKRYGFVNFWYDKWVNSAIVCSHHGKSMLWKGLPLLFWIGILIFLAHLSTNKHLCHMLNCFIVWQSIWSFLFYTILDQIYKEVFNKILSKWSSKWFKYLE